MAQVAQMRVITFERTKVCGKAAYFEGQLVAQHLFDALAPAAEVRLRQEQVEEWACRIGCTASSYNA
jgi:hypothetical protein